MRREGAKALPLALRRRIEGMPEGLARGRLDWWVGLNRKRHRFRYNNILPGANRRRRAWGRAGDSERLGVPLREAD